MPKLMDPITIRGMELKNRLGYAPMLSFSADGKGAPSEKTRFIYEQKARGGVGFIMYEGVGAQPWTTEVDDTEPIDSTGHMSYMGTDDNIPAFKKVNDAIHKYGAKSGVQLGGAGISGLMFALLAGGAEMEIVGPSKIDPRLGASALDLLIPSFKDLVKNNNLEVKEMTIEQIIKAEDEFATSAKRAVQAGFDSVEIHAAHGMLHSNFLSNPYNKRTDAYGGSIENKTRFITETIEKMRKQIGEKYPIIVRISADEFLEDGYRIDESKKIAQALEKGGADIIDVTYGNVVRSPHGMMIPTYYDYGSLIHLPEAIKKVVDIPVIGVGRIIDPKMADDFIQQGKADIIYMGRQLICDPDTLNKYLNGQQEDIKYCVGCIQGCRSTPQHCIYDAFDGLNYKELVPATELKKVVILGAGVAGMEAARMLKARGFTDVEIYEKSNKIGGLIPLIAAEYKKQDFMLMVEYLERQLKKYNVPIHLNKELSKEEITALNPDILVLAVGSEATIPVNLKDKPNIITQDESILKSKPMGKDIVVWGLEVYWKGGAETVISLIEEGYNVKALIGPEAMIGAQMIFKIGRLFWIANYIKKKKVPIFYKAKLLDVTENSVKFLDENKKEQSIEADTLVYCGSRISNGKKLKKELKGVAPKIVALGDAKRPRDIQEAIKDAQTFVRKLK